MTATVSFISLCVLLGVGHLLRSKVRLLRKLYLPSCVIGGLVGLVVLTTARGIGTPILPEVTAGWSKLPGFLINIVFACLFLGVVLPKFRTLWKRAAPQLAYGQVVAWGQYVVGVGLGYTVKRLSPEDVAEDDSIGVIPVDQRPEAGKLTVTSDAIESFTLHIVIVGVAIFFGWSLKRGLVGIEMWVNSGLTESARKATTFYRMVKPFPLFPLCMLGGLLIQIVEDKYDRHKLIDLGLMRRIQNTALDFLVVAAIAMINIQAIVPSLAPFAIIIAGAILWNVFCVVWLARRMLPDSWFERSIAEMGQSMGVTATGLLLLRTVDPDYESPAADAFASKQLLHEPFMGGGLWTSTAIPLLFIIGGPPVFLISLGACTVWLAIIFGPRLLART